MRKLICVCLSLFVLTGCSGVNSKEINNLKPMSLEEVTGKRLVNLTNAEKEDLIFKYVNDRIIVDKENLIDVSAKDISAVNSLFSNINEYLKGGKKDVLTAEYGNYLVLEFAKTPYAWEQSKIDIVGFDPAARLYFVDVTYRTTNSFKSVVADSKIPNGKPDGDLYKQKRYQDYIKYLDFIIDGNTVEANKALSNFEKAWGVTTDIFAEQQGISLLERTRELADNYGGIGKLTYSTLIENSTLNQSASMVMRYVLKYNFNLGEELDLGVNALYLKSYTLDNQGDLNANHDKADPDGVEVLKPFIDKLVNSYNKAVEESNAQGLYALYSNYSKADKYYDSLRDYMYLSYGSYTYKVLERKGTSVIVQIDRASQFRPKGSDMSLPTYKETLKAELVMDTDDTLRIKSIVPVKIDILGEPLSVIKNVNGISDTIQYASVSLTDSNKAGIKDVISKFNKVSLAQDVSSTDFLGLVDLGISQVSLQRIIDTTLAIKANKKIVYIISMDTATNVYASITIRELFEGDTTNFDTEAVIELVNRDGEWKIIDYIRNISIKTGEITMDTSNALCIDEK